MPQVNTRFERMVSEVSDRLAKNRRVRRHLPVGGRLHIDRQLPFLCVFRMRSDTDDGTEALVTTEASYLILPAAVPLDGGIARLCDAIVQTMVEAFGAFLLVEVWSVDCGSEVEPWAPSRPGFRIATRHYDAIPSTVDALRGALERIEIDGLRGKVSLQLERAGHPPQLPPLLADMPAGAQAACFTIGIEVSAVYRDPRSGQAFPHLLGQLRRQFSQALQTSFCAFAGMTTVAAPKHYEALGRRDLLRAVGDVDQRLCEVADQIEFLLLVTPANADAAWREFQQQQFERQPEFYYRPLPFNPATLKRQLFEIPLAHIEDVTLSQLLEEKQDELDRRITMLRDRGTRQFFHGSMQVYGPVEDTLGTLADQLLQLDPPLGPDGGNARSSAALRARERARCVGVGRPPIVEARGFAAMARKEIDYYRSHYAGFDAAVVLCDDIVAGVMVSGSRLLVSNSFRASRQRAETLLHHEVGTHLLTWFNGRAQPLRQLSVGLAGYESLQEGLAVLAEYLVGGLTRRRLRRLAARVVACRALCDGATFIDVFRLLRHQHRFAPQTAFRIALRIFRGGGFTKDAIYLRGLSELLDYLGGDHDVEPLYVGKIALAHVPLIQQLRRREIIQPPPVYPRFREDPQARRRLERCRGGLTIQDLANAEPP